MYRLFQLAQRYLECGHLLLEQAAHMTAYELILECKSLPFFKVPSVDLVSMDKCEEVLEYIRKSVDRRLGDSSLQYASAMNAVGALCYARLQLLVSPSRDLGPLHVFLGSNVTVPQRR